MKKLKLIEQAEFYGVQLTWFRKQAQEFNRIWIEKEINYDIDKIDEILKAPSDILTMSDQNKTEHLIKIHENLNEKSLKKLANTISVYKKRSSREDKRIELYLDYQNWVMLKDRADHDDMTQSELVTKALNLYYERNPRKEIQGKLIF